jgi:DNA-binding transcriptional ArsR family regulator
MKDARRTPFCWQEVATLRAIKERCSFPGTDGKPLSLAHALSIYVAATWLANDRFRDGGRDGFEASRAELAAYAGVSDRTVDRYVALFEEMGLLVVERQRRGGLNLPNRWVLTGGGEASSLLANRVRHGGEAVAPGGGELNSTLLEEVGEEEKNPQTPASGGLRLPDRPIGNRERDLDAYETAVAAVVEPVAQRLFPQAEQRAATGHVRAALIKLKDRGVDDPTVDQVRELAGRWLDTPEAGAA